MFAPVGHVPFTQLLWNALDDKLLLEASNIIFDERKNLGKFLSRRRDDLILEWVILYCIDYLSIFNAKSGTLMRVDGRRLFSIRFKVDLTNRVLGENSRFVPSKSVTRKFNICNPLSATQVYKLKNLINKSKNCVDEECENSEYMLKDYFRDISGDSGFTQVPLFFELETGSISFLLFNEIIKFPHII